ncbi:hypothetical protein HL658_09930 [Azospirillum sp. RWY-5-1]|uniref:Mor transcription activator domain-containing protein n=1 Tax=Azospirillum oleiclasticum TaxID=2735135 RepID=A0ABX2T9T4_9PROT|nr:hypothetical protein [Azospirillum oleiclasticum]NYZ12871.1 hypothetical protein [Azospirillum oleiclasticum]NYZ20031.1 hypothetical protein [Azospirillum oleiclasticum]
MSTARRPDPRIRRRRLPGLLGQIEDLVGYEAAERFAVTFGGQEVYIPVVCPAGHPIAKAIGHRRAREVCAVFGRQGPLANGSYSVPVADVELKWNIARALRLAGKSRNEIVRTLRARYGLVSTTTAVSQLTSDLPRPEPDPAAPDHRHRAPPPPDPTLWEYGALLAARRQRAAKG